MLADIKIILSGWTAGKVKRVPSVHRWEWVCVRWSRVRHQRSVWQHHWLVFLPVLPGLQWRRTLLFWWVSSVCVCIITICICPVALSVHQWYLWHTNHTRCVPAALQHTADSSPSGLSLFTDIDECAVNNGHCQHNCTNEPGAYSCQCASGYQLDQGGHNCTGKTRVRSRKWTHCWQYHHFWLLCCEML